MRPSGARSGMSLPGTSSGAEAVWGTCEAKPGPKAGERARERVTLSFVTIGAMRYRKGPIACEEVVRHGSAYGPYRYRKG